MEVKVFSLKYCFVSHSSLINIDTSFFQKVSFNHVMTEFRTVDGSIICDSNSQSLCLLYRERR